jgi:hypothetical protein
VDGTWPVRLTIKQSDVPAGFRMPVPVRAELESGEVEKTVLVARPEETFDLRFPSRPRSVILNPDDAVLARVRKE